MVGLDSPSAPVRTFLFLQGAAGLAWCLMSSVLADATLGSAGRLPWVPLAMLALSAASICAGVGVRGAVSVTAVGMTGVAAALAVFATVTGTAGWGAVLTLCGACGSLTALAAERGTPLSMEKLMIGPFRFRSARASTPYRLLGATALQMVAFTAVLIAALPWAIRAIEERWGLHVSAPEPVRWGGWILFALAAAVSVSAVVTMASKGRGTPVPSAMARQLVTSGPYRFVRNPMAIGGIGQALGVGLATSSWMTVAYALAAAVVWHLLIRPVEEADLEARFGAPFRRYRSRVACWVPLPAALVIRWFRH